MTTKVSAPPWDTRMPSGTDATVLGRAGLAFALKGGKFPALRTFEPHPMTLHKALSILGLVCAIAGAAHAQEQPPGVVARGSSDVLSGGLPVARQGDATTSPGGVVTEGSSDVLINGKPAARLGDRTNCGVVVRGSSSVYINGKPMARTGDSTSGC